MKNRYPYIARISSPADLKKLSAEELFPLCEELRSFLIEKVTETGGHLASNLGVVELSVALHRVFDSPTDNIIFDVGHQSYVHKILTGRAAAFDTLRTPGGLSGFPKRTESPHDAFGTGHSSTSLSAALGFAHAAALKGEERFTVAVVGDGAFTGGMIHEALNNCDKSLRLVIVLNDNEMSISRNTGAFARYLSRIRISRRYNATKRKTRSLLLRVPLVGRPLKRFISFVKRKLRRTVYKNNYFEELGFTYLGPVDGHDEGALERAFSEAKTRENVTVVHVLTQKGKGYAAAEEDPTAFHGVSPEKKQPSEEGFGAVAAEALSALADEDAAVCAVTAAMKEGTGLSRFAAAHPDRFFDVGIAEEHALTFSAGLAAAGLKPYFAVYSTFLQRAYDNLLHDVALQKLPVRLLVDRASLAEGDGATHHGIFDVAFASHIPGIRLLAPATHGSLRAMIRASREVEQPLLIRYPKGAEDERVPALFYPDGDYENYGVRALGTANPHVVILTYGSAVSEVLDAVWILGQGRVRAEVLLLETLAPFDATAARVAALLPDGVPLLFVEEAIREGGAGMLLETHLREQAAKEGRDVSFRVLGVNGHFADPSLPVSLRAFCGIDGESVVREVLSLLREKDNASVK